MFTSYDTKPTTTKMGKRRAAATTTTSIATRSQTTPSSPTHSFSSSNFEFTVSLSPRKSSAANLCPADDIFYKGQLLPLQPSTRDSMVRTLLASSSSSSDTTTTTASTSRDSTGSSNDSYSSFGCNSSRPSSATEDDDFKRFSVANANQTTTKKPKNFSFSGFSNVFRKEPKTAHSTDPDTFHGPAGPNPVKRMCPTAKEFIHKYLKKVKPLFEKLSHNDRHKNVATRMVNSADVNNNLMKEENNNATIKHSFLDNLRHPMRKRGCVVASCPGSMRSSPSHSGVLSRKGFTATVAKNGVMTYNYADSSSSMEELQSAVAGAIAHCKNSMMQNNNRTRNFVEFK